MTVATIVHLSKYAPPHKGGIESVVASAARGAADAGYEVAVVCFSGSAPPLQCG